MNRKIILSSITACAVVGLVGCGGGSSSTTTSDTLESAKITGVAVDDLIVNGVVSVLDGDGKELAQTRTLADGSYTVDVEHKGVVVVNVSCDENSTMLNAETNQTVACPSDVKLNSIANIDGTDEDIAVNVSPLSEVAYQRAKELAQDKALSEDNVVTARSQVALAFNVDPVSTNPITNSTYKGVVAAIQQVAQEQNTSVIAITNTLSEALADGVVENTEDGISDIVEAIKENNISTPISDNNGSIVLPENPASIDDLSEAKDFVKELRTQVDTVKNFADNEAVNIDKAFNNMAINMEYIDRITNDIAGLIGDMVDNDLDSITDMHLSQDRTVSIKKADDKWSYTIKEDDMSWSGYVSFSDSLIGDGAEDEIYKTQTLSFIIDGELPLDETNTKDKQIVNLDIKTNITADKGATATIKGKIDTNGDVLEIKTADLELAYVKGEADEDGDTEPQFNYVKLNKLDVEGKAGGYTVDGTLDITSYVQNDYMKDDGGFIIEEHGGISGTLECKSNINVNSIEFSYDGKTYKPDYTNIDGEIYNFRFEDLPANLEYGEWEQYITYDASCEDGESVEFHNYGSWGYDDEALNNSGWLPNKASFTGSITSATDSLNGVLSLEWLDAKTNNPDEDKDPEVKATLNGKLQMKDRPELTINLNLDTQAREFSADYTYDKTVINLTAKETITDDKSTVTYHATNQLGDVLDMVDKDGAAISGSLTKDGRELGSLEEREDAPIIKYIDGSFETLF